MTTESVIVHFRIAGKQPHTNRQTSTGLFRRKGHWRWLGLSEDHYVEIHAPAGYVAIGPSGSRWSVTQDGGSHSVSLMNSHGRFYKFKIHIGTRGWEETTVNATFFGDFIQHTTIDVYQDVTRNVTVNKSQKDYILQLDCKTLVPANWHGIASGLKQALGNTNLRIKFTNSPTDPNETTQGQYMWVRYSDVAAPSISNIRPSDSNEIFVPRPEIMADFDDGAGSGIDLSTFKLLINDGSPEAIEITQASTEDDGLIKLSDKGFVYRPTTNLKSQTHNIFITVADKQGNVVNSMTSFDVNFRSYNESIGTLDVTKLGNLGASTAAKYNSQGITEIGHLVNENPRTLSSATGLNLRTVIDHIKRAQIVCTEVKFIRGDFGELYSHSLNDITLMTDQELIDLDVTIESPEELSRIRDSIASLYVCLDDTVLNSLKFGDIIWDQAD